MKRRVVAAAGLALISTILMGPVRADVTPSSKAAPYDGTDGWEGCDAEPGSLCVGDATGDIATGRIQNSWTVTSPEDGTAPGRASGRADRYMWTELMLDEPSGAVELTFRIHINEASASTTNPQMGVAESQLLLGGFATCDGGGACMMGSNEVLVTSTSGNQVRQNEDIVRTVRVVNQLGGNIPAGPLRASVEVYGGAFIGDYQTSAAGSSSLVNDLVWTSVDATVEPALPEPPPPPPVRHVVVSRPYIGGDLVNGALTCQHSLPVRPAVGGACFQVPPGATAATVAIGDLVNDPVGGTAGLDPTGFCGTSQRLVVAHYWWDFPVRVDGPLGTNCGFGGFGTIGVITVTFEIPTQSSPGPYPVPLPVATPVAS